MGHRSSKLSAGPTNGNTSNNNKSSTKDTSSSSSSTLTSTKLSKQSTRRHSSRFPKSRIANSESNKNYRNSIASLTSNSTNVAAVYGDQFLPILRLDSSDSIAEGSDLSGVANNSSGQIIIKIRFKTQSPGDMDNAADRAAPSTAGAASTDSEFSTHSVAARNESCLRLLDTNSNKVLAAGSSPNTTLNNNSISNSNNNNRASLPVHLNALRITEPLLDQEVDDAGTAEYYEVTEEAAAAAVAAATPTTRSRPADSSRRQKAKSAFMNFRSILETSSSSSKSQLHKITNCSNKKSNNNKINSSSVNHSHSIPQNLPVPTTAAQIRPTTSTPSSASSSSIYHGTPLSNPTTTAITSTSLTPTPLTITTSTATLPPSAHNSTTTNQLAIWASNKDVIISAINLVVCPTSTTGGGVTLERLMSTDSVAGNVGGNVNSVTANQLSRREEREHMSGARQGWTHFPPTMLAATAAAAAGGPIVHSQVDFVHYLVPDLERIFNSSFYWGKMDRYEAERLLEGKPEGTFLLRDSAQEEYLFSVTFRKYGRSLHARIEQSGHKFSFDCHDPAVFSTSTVTGLLEHYKDPGSVMFFEPMLTVPFHRKTVFSLQQLARAAIVSNTTYDGISELELPLRLKAYLKEYHYRQKLRVKLLDETLLACT